VNVRRRPEELTIVNVPAMVAPVTLFTYYANSIGRVRIP
jgi:hypothetical protein